MNNNMQALEELAAQHRQEFMQKHQATLASLRLQQTSTRRYSTRSTRAASSSSSSASATKDGEENETHNQRRSLRKRTAEQEVRKMTQANL